jgi:hypothetical protein
MSRGTGHFARQSRPGSAETNHLHYVAADGHYLFDGIPDVIYVTTVGTFGTYAGGLPGGKRAMGVGTLYGTMAFCRTWPVPWGMSDYGIFVGWNISSTRFQALMWDPDGNSGQWKRDGGTGIYGVYDFLSGEPHEVTSLTVSIS